MTEGLRIGRIVIEGFKGFTDAQELEMRHRHLFLIGPNGNGKSSIIEAIRWGLFGSTNRPNDIVRNEGYGGDCRVEIDFLARDGKQWFLRRTLKVGGGDSRAELFDEGHIEHRLRDVLPQMDSLDAGEGTHIIFSPQSAPLRRQPEDLTAFERTVFDHLGLKHPRAMLSHLEAFIQGQEEVEDSLDGSVSEARRTIDGRIVELEDRRGRIMGSQPWGGDLLPSRQQTRAKAQSLIGRIKTTDVGEDISHFSLGVLVDEAEMALDDRAGSDGHPLHQELDTLNDQLSRLESIRTAQEDIEHQKARLREAHERLRAFLEGTSIDALQRKVQDKRRQARTRDLQQSLGQIAAELIDRSGSEGSTLCPICGVGREQDEWRHTISEMLHGDGEVEDSDLVTAEDQLKKAQQLERDVQECNDSLRNSQSSLDAMIKVEHDQGLAPGILADSVSDHIESLTEQRASIEQQINDLDNWLQTIQTELTKLRDEADYQKIQRDIVKLKAVDAEMHLVQQAYESLVTFGHSARDICDTIGSTLKKELRAKTPSVADDLTRIFSALTRHPYFDRLVFDEQKLPKLELRVASSSDTSKKQHPTGVLNGQAQSALALVPYFALSQVAETPTEVYLVLLDDPTRAFDREHIQILIEQLADLGERVQVVVATQETEAFRELLPRSFPPESYVIVEPESWSYAGGPRLVTTDG